jgi:Chaperone for protein-folding within the ER, fungal
MLREQKYEQLLDPYHNIQRLNLYRFDGSPIPAMYLAYRPPQMVPTSTLHPQATAFAKSSTKAKLKRALDYVEGPQAAGTWIDTQRLWCFGLGVGTIGIGGVLMFLS